MDRERNERVHVIATQHLDVAWLWMRVPHGEELMRRCFQAAVEMIEAWPQHRLLFSRSTAWSFYILEQRDPALFAKVRRYVDEGRIELCGGEWVEPDHLMPDGEALVRQCAYGQWYYQEAFGKTASVCWDPDIFGHSGTMPQIIRRAGMIGFYAHRCRPTDEEERPLYQFVWEGLDGTRIMYLAGQWVARPDAETLSAAAEEMRARGYPATHVATGLGSDRKITMRMDWVPLPAQADQNPELPACGWSTAGAAARAMEDYAAQLPVVRGELGFQFTGTYTSNGQIKRANRRLEALLLGAEKAALLAGLDEGPDYQGQFTQAWRDLCINQFHDICCGCCYNEAHQEALELFADVERRGLWLLDEALGRIIARTATDAVAEARPVAVYNPLSWPHRGPIEMAADPQGELEAVADDGTAFPTQRITLPDGRDGLTFRPGAVSGIGLSVYYLRERSGEEPAASVQVSEQGLENDRLRVELDPATGALTRLYLKGEGTEEAVGDLLRPGGQGNRLVFYQDRTPIPGGSSHGWQPWRIGYTGRSWQAPVSAVRVMEAGPVRGRLRVEREMRFADDLPPTRIVQDMILYAGSPILYFATEGDWQAREIMLKAEFDLSFSCDEVVSEAPYGIARRAPNLGVGAGRMAGADSASADTAAEDGLRPDVTAEEPDRPMQKWVDVSDGERGLALLNNGKYGYDAGREVVRLSLLRAPLMREELDEIIGLGPFAFAYALLPHRGDWRDADVPRRAYELNDELLARAAEPHEGSPPASLVSVDEGDVMVTAAKRAEDGEGIVLRLYSAHGRRERATLSLGRPIARAVECDLLERAADDPACAIEPTGELSWQGQALRVTLAPFEIKTLRVWLDV